MEILKTIIPIFIIIFLGSAAKKKGWITDGFIGPANRLAFNLAVPALIFKAIAGTDFTRQFNAKLLAGTLLPVVIVYLAAWMICGFFNIDRKYKGTLIESTMHGNVGYAGLAIVFYYLDQESFAVAAVLTGFLAIAHNFLAVIVLQANAPDQHSKHGPARTLTTVVKNPIIISAVAAILISSVGIEIPTIIDRTLAILGNLGLPLALLVIGASLSLRIQKRQLWMISFAALGKLLVLPAVGFSLYHFFSLAPAVYLPGLILLTCPVATFVYILASELDGDTDLAVNIISVTTPLSALTITLWIGFITSN
jgi:predicted permease